MAKPIYHFLHADDQVFVTYMFMNVLNATCKDKPYEIKCQSVINGMKFLDFWKTGIYRAGVIDYDMESDFTGLETLERLIVGEKYSKDNICMWSSCFDYPKMQRLSALGIPHFEKPKSAAVMSHVVEIFDRFHSKAIN